MKPKTKENTIVLYRVLAQEIEMKPSKNGLI